MSMSEEQWTHELREQPPIWPRREAGGQWTTQRWLREPEPFEDRGIFEPYPGATVLEDLDASGDETTSLRILARYTAVRLMLLATGRLIVGPKLRTECRVAREHLALMPAHDWERHVLERLCDVCCGAQATVVLDAAIVAAESAAKRGHNMGAFALYRAAYELARDGGLWPGAARAASGIARLARLAGQHYSTRVWRWRTGVLIRRARRDEERELAREGERATEPADDGS